MLFDYMVKKNNYNYIANMLIPLNSELVSFIKVIAYYRYSSYPKAILVHYDQTTNMLIEFLGIIDEETKIFVYPLAKVGYMNGFIPKCFLRLNYSAAYVMLTKLEFVTLHCNAKNDYDIYNVLFTNIDMSQKTQNGIDTLKTIQILPTIDFISKIPNVFEFQGDVKIEIPDNLNIKKFIVGILNIAYSTLITDFAYVDNNGQLKNLEFLIRYNVSLHNIELIKQDLKTKLDQLVNWFCNIMGFKPCLAIIQKNYFGEIMVTIYKNDKPIFKQYIDALSLLCFPEYGKNVGIKEVNMEC